MKKPALVLLAAGMGSRYGGLKQMDPMDEYGNLIIDFSIFDALRAGFEDIVFIIKHEIEADFREIIGRRMESRANVSYAFQQLDKLDGEFFPLIPKDRVKPLGTTHAVLCAREAIGDRPFAIINSDDYYGAQAYRQLYGFLTADGKPHAHALIGYNVENTLTEHGSVARGVCEVDKSGFLAKITERTNIIKTDACAAYSTDGGKSYTDIAKGTTVSMNCWAFMPDIFDGLKEVFQRNFRAGITANPMKYEDLLPNAVQSVMDMRGDTVKVLPTVDRWFGVTYHEDKPVTMAAFKKLKEAGVYSEKLW